MPWAGSRRSRNLQRAPESCSSVVVAITAARVIVGQTKDRNCRAPANVSAVPVLSSRRAVAMMRVRRTRQCDNSSCDDKNCHSQCDAHGFTPPLSPHGLHSQYSISFEVLNRLARHGTGIHTSSHAECFLFVTVA